jgi:hypothetical protein
MCKQRYWDATDGVEHQTTNNIYHRCFNMKDRFKGKGRGMMTEREDKSNMKGGKEQKVSIDAAYGGQNCNGITW